LQPGDLITSIEGSPMRRTSDIRMELSRSASDKAQIEVLRGKARRRLEIETGRTALTRPLQGVRQVSQPR
jgi:S1-C subfamily serine protease